MDGTICFDRNGRSSPYGFEEDDDENEEIKKENAISVMSPSPIDWAKVRWGELQNECSENNALRFDPLGKIRTVLPLKAPDAAGGYRGQDEFSSRNETTSGEHSLKPKAVLVRSWDGMWYNSEVVQHLRAMITELSLHAGGEYSVYLMVEVTDPALHVEESEDIYRQVLKDHVPEEFRDIAILYDTRLLELWYDQVGYYGGDAAHSNQVVQVFSLQNPQFSHVWDVSIDARYTGNWYRLLSGSMQWARDQPRKHQWERAARFYIPALHGTYSNFSTRIAAETMSDGIWGPVPSRDVLVPQGPLPPHTHEIENGEDWGVGEEADDIVPSALINTAETELFSHNQVKGFEDSKPRRALMISPIKCFSRRLLKIMHQAQIDGYDMQPELFPHTLALMHGLKVAAVPLPVYFDTDSTPREIDEILNNDPSKSFFSDEEPSTMAMKVKLTMWKDLGFDAFPQMLYRKWLGVDGSGRKMRNSLRGRMCLPEMLIYPVTNVVAE